jgi:hypothetical protein
MWPSWTTMRECGQDGVDEQRRCPLQAKRARTAAPGTPSAHQSLFSPGDQNRWPLLVLDVHLGRRMQMEVREASFELEPENRNVEYDTFSDAYATFLLTEIRPNVQDESGHRLCAPRADLFLALLPASRAQPSRSQIGHNGKVAGDRRLYATTKANATTGRRRRARGE